MGKIRGQDRPSAGAEQGGEGESRHGEALKASRRPHGTYVRLRPFLTRHVSRVPSPVCMSARGVPADSYVAPFGDREAGATK